MKFKKVFIEYINMYGSMSSGSRVKKVRVIKRKSKKANVKKSMKRKLSKSQTDRLKRHSAHHTKKHMSMMRKRMRMGKSFSQAHAEAKRKVGK